MDDKKLIKRALRLQSMSAHFLNQTTNKDRIGREQWISTSYGVVRVLEYGFDSQEVAPLFVNMHAGGFVLGCADMDDGMCDHFNRRTGVKVISIDYPKAPQNPYPSAVNAVYDVVRNYVDNAKNYKIDTNSIGIGGQSAGGNLAAVACIVANEHRELSFKYQLLNYPPCDMSIDPLSKPDFGGAASPKMVIMYDICYFEADRDKAKSPYISPMYATEEQLSNLPPTLIIAAGKDSLYEEIVRYSELLKKAGVNVEFHNFCEAEHGFTYMNNPDSKKAWGIMNDFIKMNI